MEEVLSRLQTLTSDQLREEIIKAGLKCGPVTATTRGIFEKKLARALVETQGGRGHSEGGSDRAADSTCSESQPLASDSGAGQNSPQTTDDDVSPQASPESPSLFYGVLPPLDDSLPFDGPLHVYADKQKALKAVMKMKGARFKAFSSRVDAENFAKGIYDGSLSPNKHLPEASHITSPAAEKSTYQEMMNMEKPNEFKSPRVQDLTAKLRKTVEKGDEETFKVLVWGNPRYLIGSGDNPTIVQEGCRYNVLHVAAKENQPGMARLILETLESPDFMRLMYPNDQEDMLWQRIDYIVDLYLNTPDKGSNETPLHFACKFGCSEVVNVLCSHPAVDKNCRNKYGQKPSNVICERKNKNKETKEKIVEYLEDRFFVPLLRATDNTLNPVIGTPWAPGSSEFIDPALAPGLVDDPKNPVMTIRAFAGPLNPSKAEEFHKLWKTPPRGRARYFHDILKSDPDRGAERVGRELAHEMGHAWAEYWDFLNCFIDLSSDNGLNMLEEYFDRIVQQKKATEKMWTHRNNPASSTGAGYISGTFLDDNLHSPSGATCGRWADESTPRSFHEKSPVCDLLQDFERVSLDKASEEAGENTVDSGLGYLTGSRGGNSLGLADHNTEKGWDWMEDGDSSSEEYYTADEGTDRANPWSQGERDLSSSGSSNSSFKSTHSTPEETWTKDGFGRNIFLAGEVPSKLDHEVLLAVTGAELEQQLYPCLSKWKDTVLSFPASERRSDTQTARESDVDPSQADTQLAHRVTQLSNDEDARQQLARPTLHEH